MESKKLHVAMFPWVAFGHIIPFLELSKLIAQKGHKISFISTPRNIDRLPKLPPEFTTSITFVKINLPQVEGLPPNAEATMDIQNDDMPLLKKAYDGLELELASFLEESLPDWILHDFAPYWLPPVAARLGINKALYSIFNAWFFVIFGTPETMIHDKDPRTRPEDFMVQPKWVPFDTKVVYKRFEADWVLGAHKPNEIGGVSDGFRLGWITEGVDVLFVRQCNEFEGAWLNLLAQVYNKPVIPVGMIPPVLPLHNADDKSWIEIKDWLDAQEKDSVLYVALGSEVSLNQAQITELALGLELSGIKFFWVFRKTSGQIELPDEFEKRIEGKGIVWKNWVPQLKILSHESVGGFLTHCGWSSCIEGLMLAKPLIMLPFLVDQGLNARLLEEKQVGIEVPRNEQDGSYTRDSVAETIRLVMTTGIQNQNFKENSKEWSAVIGDRQLHDRYIHDFIQYLVNNRIKHQEQVS